MPIGHDFNRVGRRLHPAIAAFVAVAVITVAIVSGPARAQDNSSRVIHIPLHKAGIVKLSGAANNVIVGNPAVADVTVENPTTLVLFGRGPGETNILVLGAGQKEILSAAVVVATDKDRQLSVLAPSRGKDAGMIEILYACADRCVRFPADLTKLATQTGSGGSSDGDTGFGGKTDTTATAPSTSTPESDAQGQGQGKSGKY